MSVQRVCVVQPNIQLSCDGGMGVKRVEKITRSKWMSARRISLWQPFLHFSPEVPTRHSLYTNAKEKKKFISRIFALKKIKANSVDFLQFLELFIFHSKLRGRILFYVVNIDVCRVLRLFWRMRWGERLNMCYLLSLIPLLTNC
jgi:hypothetical protein